MCADGWSFAEEAPLPIAAAAGSGVAQVLELAANVVVVEFNFRCALSSSPGLKNTPARTAKGHRDGGGGRRAAASIGPQRHTQRVSAHTDRRLGCGGS